MKSTADIVIQPSLKIVEYEKLTMNEQASNDNENNLNSPKMSSYHFLQKYDNF